MAATKTAKKEEKEETTEQPVGRSQARPHAPWLSVTRAVNELVTHPKWRRYRWEVRARNTYIEVYRLSYDQLVASFAAGSDIHEPRVWITDRVFKDAVRLDGSKLLREYVEKWG